MAPHFEAAASESRIPFVKVDIDEADRELLDFYGIMHVPTIIEVTETSSRFILARTAPALIKETE